MKNTEQRWCLSYLFAGRTFFKSIQFRVDRRKENELRELEKFAKQKQDQECSKDKWT